MAFLSSPNKKNLYFFAAKAMNYKFDLLKFVFKRSERISVPKPVTLVISVQVCIITKSEEICSLFFSPITHFQSPENLVQVPCNQASLTFMRG